MPFRDSDSAENFVKELNAEGHDVKFALDDKTGLPSIMYHDRVVSRVYEAEMKVAEAKKYFSQGLIKGLHINQVDKGKFEVVLTLEGFGPIPIEKFRGGVRIFNSVDAAINTVKEIGCTEVTVKIKP